MSSTTRSIQAEYPESSCDTEVSIGDEKLSGVTREAHTEDEESALQGILADLDENILLNDDLGIEFEGLNQGWRFCVGVTGALDILACVLPNLVRYFGHTEEHFNSNSHLTSIPSFVGHVSEVLDRHDTTISFIFSAMWFIDSFLAAHTRRVIFLRKDEQSRYLEKEETSRQWWQTASFVYYRSMTLQLLLLPVGFYFLLFYGIDRLVHGKGVEDLEYVDHSLTLAVSTADHEVRHESFSTHSRLSVLFAIVQHIVIKISGSTTRALQSKIGSFLKSLRPAAIKTLLSQAIRNPRRFRRRIGKALTAFRWIKYLAPLIGAINKLKGNVGDMLKKQRQKRIAEKQRRIRQLLWEEAPLHIREEEAAIMIQSAFRAYMSRKSMDALLLLQGDSKRIAASRLQRALRESLWRARYRLQKKASEFKRISAIHKEETDALDNDAKKRLFQIQDQLAAEAKRLINKKLLLRPNTRFAVAWKSLFILCIIFEIAQLGAKPWLENYKNKGNGERMTMSDFIALSFTPTRASQREECGYRPEKKMISPMNFFSGHRRRLLSKEDKRNLPWYCKRPGATIQEGYSDFVSLVLVPVPVSKWPDCRAGNARRWPNKKENESRRWYCHEPYSSTHALYRNLVDFILDRFLVIVSLVCFLDVFVTFFTGELDDLSGALVPKPFFARWIIPGLMLQLLLNPHLDFFADCVGIMWDSILEFGPIRVLRWSVTTLFPVSRCLWRAAIKYIWMPLVEYENEVEDLVDEIF